MIKPGTLRFLLALIVIVGHAAPQWIFLGHFAVICFFILSGYWITHLYDQQYISLLSPLPVFYISRAWRLLPMLLLFTVLAAVTYSIFEPEIFQKIAGFSTAGKIKYWLSHLLTFGLALQSPRLLAPSWSLDIELQFYAIFPLLYFFINRYTMRAISILTLLAALVTAGFTWMLLSHDSVWTHTIVYYAVFFLAGIFIYYRGLKFDRKTEWICNILFLFSVGLMYANIISRGSRIANETLPFLLIPLISNSVHQKSGRLDAYFGNISYVLYLAHWVCFVALDHYFHFSDETLPVGQKLIYLLVYLLATFVLSIAAYGLVDKKLNLRRKKWVARQPKIVINVTVR